MSFIHYLFIGHFDREDDHMKFVRPGPGEPYRPVVVRPLTPEEIAPVVRDVTGEDSGQIPDGWSAWLDDGYLVCDKYTRNAAEIEFISRLTESTGSALYDAAGHVDLSLSEWLAVERGAVKT